MENNETVVGNEKEALETEDVSDNFGRPWYVDGRFAMLNDSDIKALNAVLKTCGHYHYSGTGKIDMEMVGGLPISERILFRTKQGIVDFLKETFVGIVHRRIDNYGKFQKKSIDERVEYEKLAAKEKIISEANRIEKEI